MDPTVMAAAIGVGGTVVVGVVGYWASVRNTSATLDLTRRTLDLTEQGQVTDRYNKAIEQLGSTEIDVRIGGIYALERIAHDSARDYPTVMEVLAEFVRDHSPEQWPPPTVHEAGAEPPGRTTRPDVQAAPTVIARRTIRNDRRPINLNRTRANLTNVDLNNANLTRANLGKEVDLRAAADFRHVQALLANVTDPTIPVAHIGRGGDLAGGGADLRNARAVFANFTHAILADANLSDAIFSRANLTGANLTGADLTNTQLISADLTRADLTYTTLTGADLTGAKLTDADLTDALWPRGPRAEEVPEGWQQDSRSGRLKRAATDADGAATD
jgi:Pentapeptide repeats (8 copies)